MTIGQSTLRLFLSVDVAGSTALKHEVNYESLSIRIKRTKDVVERMKHLDRDECVALEHAVLSEEDIHWARIPQGVFDDFHTRLYAYVGDLAYAEPERFPWKALGDELVYSFRLVSRAQAAQLLGAFIRTLRLTDGELFPKNRIRLKGTVWTAGFPVRNCEVRLPIPKTFRNIGTPEQPQYVEFPYPRIDYLGPDMDIGFRLGRVSFPGMCVASLDVVELFSDENSANQMRFAHVGWEALKGVWEQRPYPIFWADLPHDPNAAEQLPMTRPWAEAESSLVRTWNADGARREAKSFKVQISEIRHNLPARFGALPPYIVGPDGDGDPVPAPHRELLNLLQRLDEHPVGLANQQPLDDARQLGDSGRPTSDRSHDLVAPQELVSVADTDDEGRSSLA